jgi:hypothetical protein
MDWFERLMGFRETDYDDTRAKLKVEGTQLQSLINGKSYGTGELEETTDFQSTHLHSRRGYALTSTFELVHVDSLGFCDVAGANIRLDQR